MSEYLKIYEKKFNVNYPESNNATYSSVLNYSNEKKQIRQRWYNYKEGFSTELIKRLFFEYSKNIKNGIFLDPFAGCGTTLLEMNELNNNSIGFETNPFTYFLLKVKTASYSKADINSFKNKFESIIIDIDKEKLKTYKLPALSIANKVFDKKVEKYFMSFKVYNDNCKNVKVKNLLKLCWLASLEYLSNYRKAGNGLKIKKYKKKKILDKKDVIKTLTNNFNLIYEDLINNKLKSNKMIIYNQSCLRMGSKIHTNSIDGIIFSPPYANCFDYAEIYKLELWFGDFVKTYDELRSIKNNSLRSHLNFSNQNVKTEPLINPLFDLVINDVKKAKLWDKRIIIMLYGYFSEIKKVLEECYKLLKKKGFCSIVVGNSVYGNFVVPTDLILADMAKDVGFNVDKIDVDRYIITSSQQYNNTKKYKKYIRESVVCLIKN